MNAEPTPVLLAYPFRPFFLLTGGYGLLLVIAWMGFLFAGLPLPLGMSPVDWHAHEMLFGLVPAAIAGFLLTAMSNWTGAPPLAGRRLLGLLLVWGAGRVAMWSSGLLPAGLVAAVDLLFLPALAVYAGRVLLRHGNRRNLVLVALLGLLAVGNLLMHLDFVGGVSGAEEIGELLALNLIAVMMIVIGGRITPAFSANWLRLGGGDPARVRLSPGLDRAAMISALLMIPADLVTAWSALGAGVALAAALVSGLRLWRWRGWLTAGEPLLWVLHLGQAWVVLALLLKALTPLLGIDDAAWMHALGTGAMATLILGVMTRVALGHTGRPLRLPGNAVGIYFSILLAGVARVAASLNLTDYSLAMSLSALGWTLAFGLFLAYYWPILSRARADGRPG